jgi:sulfide:quinone oxidoreductase
VEWFGETLDRLEHGHLRRLTFAVPRGVRWTLPIYELALMTGRQMRDHDVSGVVIDLVTHESSPLADLGDDAGKRIGSMLEEAGVMVHCGRAPMKLDAGELILADGHSIETTEVVALPGLRVPEIPGIPQGRHGFIPTDAAMKVDGLDRVWAAGDATWFPIKQGGIAAQQADIVAAGMALKAGAEVDVPPLRPTVRVTMLTGEEPEFFRASVAGDGEGERAVFPLWWPPGKVAGRWLAPYLAREWAGKPEDPLMPLEDLDALDDETRAEQHRSAVDLALRFAQLDADEGDLAQALRWLDVAEKLNVTLPHEYEQRRADWTELLRSRTYKGD